MKSDQFAKIVAGSIRRHQGRGLVDDASGMADVVIHGRVDLIAVADELIAASALHLQPIRRSWSTWFRGEVDRRKEDRRQRCRRADLEERLAQEPNEAEAAIIRLRLRDLD